MFLKNPKKNNNLLEHNDQMINLMAMEQYIFLNLKYYIVFI